MKQVIFESLERYPCESITGLLAIGRRSKDEGIKEVCRRHVKNG